MSSQGDPKVATARPLGWSTIARELTESRELLWTFALRDLRARYKQTILGVGWAVVQPLVFLVVFVVFFGNVAGFDDETTSYAAFALSALVSWQYFAALVSGAAFAITNEAAVMRKVYFPRLAPILSRPLTTMPQLAVGLLLMLVLAPVVDGKVTLHLLWLPLLVVILTIPALAVAIPLAALGVWFRDFAILIPILLQVWLFASPVAYPLTTLESNTMLYAFLNPVVGAVDGFRLVYVEGQPPDGTLITAGLVSSLIVLIGGIEVFRRLEPGFADVA